MSNKLSKKGLFFIILTVLFLVLVFWLGTRESDPSANMVGEVDILAEQEDWTTYTNEEYGFAIDFPSSWEIYEHFIDANPIINIYKPKSKFIEPPYDHFSEITNVSIFPNGVPTEGVAGEIETGTDLVLASSVAEVRNYVLDSGKVWATMLTFEQIPKKWKSWGFVWSRNEVTNLEYSCQSGTATINVEECNPLEGDVIVRSGEIDEEVQVILDKILASFRFLD